VGLGAWAWAVPAAALVAVTVAEAWLAARRGAAVTGTRAAAVWAGVYVFLAVAFGAGVGIGVNWASARQFFTGYLTEYSLSLDNLFIFYVIMRWFAVPAKRQHRVLAAGILLALVLRSALIVAGSAAISHFDWLFYPLAAILVWTAVNLLRSQPGSEAAEPRNRLMSWLRQRVQSAGEEDGGRLVIWRSGRPTAGPLLLLAAAIGSADLVFAFDSIPALFGITTSAGLIVACNVFALSGLRQVYVLLVRVLDRISFLNKGLAVICAFIGVKLLLQALRGSGLAWAPAVPDWLSLTVVAAVLLTTATASAVAGRRPPAGDPAGRADGERPDRVRPENVLMRRFAIIDLDGNGVWQRADYEQLTRRLCRAFGHPADSAPARALAAGQRALFDALLAHMDANGDQQITPEEFTGSIGRTRADESGFDAAVEAAADGLIQVADQDGNAVLDVGEYVRLAGQYGADPGAAARAFAQLDLDRNGVIDTAELSAAIRQFFTSPDPAVPGNLAFGRL
jgi:tellurite resistance protein TerC